VAVRPNRNQPRTPKLLLEWPPPVVQLADEVKGLEHQLARAKRGQDFAGAEVITRQLSAMTRRLEVVKLSALALPDVPSAGRPRMAGSLTSQSRISGTM
jgi:hypothetical protein